MELQFNNAIGEKSVELGKILAIGLHHCEKDDELKLFVNHYLRGKLTGTHISERQFHALSCLIQLQVKTANTMDDLPEIVLESSSDINQFNTSKN